MARPLRIEFPGAVYHVTSRGDRREPIYRDDVDRRIQLQVIGHAMERFDACALAYCQMGNHFHLVLQTQQANLSRLMRHINGVYTQSFNRRHGLTGHLLQGRFKAILVDRDAYLLALCRYVERNPVALRLVEQSSDWPWSSCRAHAGLVTPPPWLDVDALHGVLLGRPVSSAADATQARRMYADLLEQDVESIGDPGFWTRTLSRQIFLGDEGFIERMQAQALPQQVSREVPASQRRRPPAAKTAPDKTWASALKASNGNRDQALASAYRDHGLTMTALAELAGVSVSRVSRVIAAVEAKGKT